MLTRLYVDNYKCFSNFELALGPLQLLLGGNGTGKSSVLDVVEELQSLLTGRSAVAFSPSLTRWESRTRQTLELDVLRPSTGAKYRYRVELELDYKRGTRLIARESLLCDDKSLYRTEGGISEAWLGGAWSRVLVGPGASGIPLLPWGDGALDWFRAFMGRLVVLRPSPMMMLAAGKEDDYLHRNASNFVAWYRNVEPHQHFTKRQALHEKLSATLPGFDSMQLIKSVEQQQRILATTWRTDEGTESSTYDVYFGELSDGQRMLVLLYALSCWLPAPGDDLVTLMLDEPTNFVSLAEIEPWLRDVEDLTEEKKLQVTVASHGAEVVDAWARTHGVRLSRRAAGPVRAERFQTHDDDPLTPAERMARGWDDEDE